MLRGQKLDTSLAIHLQSEYAWYRCTVYTSVRMRVQWCCCQLCMLQRLAAWWSPRVGQHMYGYYMHNAVLYMCFQSSA